MRRTRTGYLMAMTAGLAIVGASTGGALLANSHHQQTLAAASSVAPVVAASTLAVSTSIPAVPSDIPAGSPSAPSNPPASAALATSVAQSSAPAHTSTSPVRSSTSAATTSAAPTTSTASARTTTAATTASAAPVAAHQFKDGKYSATGSYNSPGGIEKLGVTLTIAADTVTASQLDLQGGAGLSHSFQSAFASGYSGQVIGKKINTISLGSVSGSSLTGLGFNAALKQIESAARLQK